MAFVVSGMSVTNLSQTTEKKKKEGLLAANVPQLDEEGKKKEDGSEDYLQVDLTSAGTLFLLDC